MLHQVHVMFYSKDIQGQSARSIRFCKIFKLTSQPYIEYNECAKCKTWPTIAILIITWNSSKNFD